MAVIKYGCVVGHVPRTVSQVVAALLGKYGSAYFCEVISAIVNPPWDWNFLFTSFIASRLKFSLHIAFPVAKVCTS